MKFHNYSSQAEYIEAQKSRAVDLATHGVVWVSEPTIDAMVGFIKQNRPESKLCLCHGTCDGTEQRLIKARLDITVIGTDLMDGCEKYPDTIQWNFHDVKPEWRDAVDFIYSNALDHSPTPEVAMSQWMSCLVPGGFCFIEWSEGHGEAHITAADCFGASIPEMREWLKNFGEVVAELPATDQNGEHILFVLKRNEL